MIGPILPEMSSRNPKTNIAAITDFSSQRHLILPRSYIDFLLTINGGRPSRSCHRVAVPYESSHINIQAFLGIGVLIPTSELSYAYDLYVGGFPFGIVPIANGDSGDYICLDLRGNAERVVFWDKRHFWSTGEWREEDLYLLAHSFEVFLSGLTLPPQ
jgi:SMI1-KNR4 cell-wall